MIVTKPLMCLPDLKAVIFSDHKAASQKKRKGGLCGDVMGKAGGKTAGDSAVVSSGDWGARGLALCNSATYSLPFFPTSWHTGLHSGQTSAQCKFL